MNVAETNNKVKSYKISCVPQSSVEVEGKKLQVLLNLPKI